jgi:hypothetical protein
MKRDFVAHSTGGRAVITLILALSTAGCATGGGGQATGQSALGKPSDKVGSGQAAAQSVPGVPLTPAERRMREQSQAFARTVWEGTMVGSSSGGLMAIVTGNELSSLGGGTAGGAAGALAGSYVARKQRQYSEKEDLLTSNEETQSFIASVREVIDEDKRRLASVQQQVRKGAATAAELESTRRRIADNQAVIAQAGKGAREKQAMFQGAEREFRAKHPGTNTAPMQQQIEAFNQNINTLDSLARSVSAA